MYKATIIENSLRDTSILQHITITRTWQSGSWTLHDVLIDKDQIHDLSTIIAEGPWYIHAWEPGKDEVKVIFRDKIFNIIFSNKSTWDKAVECGISIGIPEEQLDFPIEPTPSFE